MNNEQNQTAGQPISADKQSNEKDKQTVPQVTSEFHPDSEHRNAPTTETIKSTVKDVVDKAKDSVGEAYNFASGKATDVVTEQKNNISSGLSGVAESIRQVGQSLRDGDEQTPVTKFAAQYGETIAQQIDRVSGYFENKDLPEIVRDVEGFARRQPAIFIGASFAAGLLLARFLKSSGTSDVAASANNDQKNQSSVNPNKLSGQQVQNAS